MKINDQAIEYKSLLQKTKSAIEDIGTLGFDTKPYYETLNGIIDSVENNVDSRDGTTATMFLTMDYAKGIGYLSEYYDILSKYNVYFIIMNTCKYLEIKLKDNLSKEEIEIYSKEVIDMLNKLRYSETIKYEDEQKVVEKAFNVAYELVKLELINFGESKIYEASKDHEIDCSFFNECILKDLEHIDLNDPKYESLSLELYEIKSKGLGKSYFDIDVIRALVALDSNSDIIENIKDGILSLKREIKSNKGKIDLLYIECKKSEKRIGQSKEEKKEVKKDIFKSLLSILLSVSFYLGGLFGLTVLARRLTKVSIYNKEKISYSKEYGNEEGTEEYEILSINDEPKDGIYVKAYGDWESSLGSSDTRKVKVYDMSGFDFDTLEEYLSIVRDNLEYEEESERKSDVDAKEASRSAYISVENAKYEMVGEEQSLWWLLMEMLFILVEILLIVLVEMIKYGFGNGNILESFSNLKDYFEELKNNKRCTKEQIEDLRKQTLELMELIKKDEVLKAKFDEKLKNNHYLVSLDSEFKELSKKDFEDISEKQKVFIKKIK